MWDMAKQIGYTPITTLWEQFEEEEYKGMGEVNELIESSFEHYKNDIACLTELIMIINHKSWYWYEQGNNKAARFYSELYHKFDERAINYIETNMDDKAMSYYFKTLD